MGILPSNRNEWNQAVYVTSEIAKYYFNRFTRDNFIERIPLSKDRLWTAYINFYMPKTSCLERPFSDIIRKLIKHGLVRKYIMDYTDTTGSRPSERDQQILTLEHIQGIFYICFGLYSVAFIIFLFEVLIGRFQCLEQQRRQKHTMRKRQKLGTLRSIKVWNRTFRIPNHLHSNTIHS